MPLGNKVLFNFDFCTGGGSFFATNLDVSKLLIFSGRVGFLITIGGVISFVLFILFNANWEGETSSEVKELRFGTEELEDDKTGNLLSLGGDEGIVFELEEDGCNEIV